MSAEKTLLLCLGVVRNHNKYYKFQHSDLHPNYHNDSCSLHIDRICLVKASRMIAFDFQILYSNTIILYIIFKYLSVHRIAYTRSIRIVMFPHITYGQMRFKISPVWCMFPVVMTYTVFVDDMIRYDPLLMKNHFCYSEFFCLYYL